MLNQEKTSIIELVIKEPDEPCVWRTGFISGDEKYSLHISTRHLSKKEISLIKKKIPNSYVDDFEVLFFGYSSVNDLLSLNYLLQNVYFKVQDFKYSLYSYLLMTYNYMISEDVNYITQDEDGTIKFFAYKPRFVNQFYWAEAEEPLLSLKTDYLSSTWNLGFIKVDQVFRELISMKRSGWLVNDGLNLPDMKNVDVVLQELSIAEKVKPGASFGWQFRLSGNHASSVVLYRESI